MLKVVINVEIEKPNPRVAVIFRCAVMVYLVTKYRILNMLCLSDSKVLIRVPQVTCNLSDISKLQKENKFPFVLNPHIDWIPELVIY